MPPLAILASSIFAQSFIVFVVANLLWIMYLRVREPFHKFWALSWLFYGFYLAIGGTGFLLQVGDTNYPDTLRWFTNVSLTFAYLSTYYLFQGFRISRYAKKRIKPKWLRDTFLIVLVAFVLSTLAYQTNDIGIQYLLSFSLRSLVAGIVCLLVGYRLLRAESDYDGAKKVSLALIIYGLVIQLYVLQGILYIVGSSLPPYILGSIGVVDFVIQTVIAMSFVSWVLDKEHHEVIRYQAKLQEQAWHDSLTGLPNRLWLEQRSEKTLAALTESDHATALIFIDLDGFKAVNDTYGHAVGDHLLTEVASILRHHMDKGDLVCRMGGDEFIWLIIGDEHRESVRQRAVNFREALESISQIDGHGINISCSQGIAWFPEHGVDLESLIQLSDEAMYEAKRSGKAQLIEAKNS